MERIGRRAYLATLAGTAATAFAGCGGILSSGDRAGATSSDPATSWPSFGYDAANTGYNPVTDAPGDDPAVDWEFETGLLTSDPVVAAGTVAVGTPERVYAVDAADGSERWHVDRNGPLMYPPVIDTGAVYLVDGESVVAVDAIEGSQRWRYEAGSRTRHGALTSSGGRLYVHTADHLHAIDANEGERVWRVESGAGVGTTPAVADGTVYVGPGRFGSPTGLYARDAETGDRRWGQPLAISGTDQCVSEGRIYVGMPNEWYAAYDTDGGERIWQVDTGSHARAVAPAATDGVVVGGTLQSDVYGLDPVDGTEHWSSQADHRVEFKPAVADGTVFVGSPDGRIYGLNIDDGTERWRVAPPARPSSSPAVADGTLYVAGGGERLFAIR